MPTTKKRLLLASAAILVIVLSALILLAVFNQKPNNSGSAGASLKGVSLSPRSFEGSDFTDFFDKAKQAGTIVSWAGDWNELSNTANGGASVAASLASTYSYTPVIEAQFFNQSNGALLRPLDSATIQSYRDGAVEVATKYNLRYLGLGIEVNLLYEKSPADFGKFVQLYNSVYDSVKAA